MRMLHLLVPHLALELARARSGPSPSGPLVLGGRPWDRGPVIDASVEARDLGVRRGMPLAGAHHLVPEATFLDLDPDADRAAAEAVFEALSAFSPSLAGSSDPTEAIFGRFEVGVDGLGPLWGPEPVLAAQLSPAVEATLARDPAAAAGPGGAASGACPSRTGSFLPRVGVAGTRFAAAVAAGCARPGSPVLVPVGAEAAFLADLPSRLLTTDPDVRARLVRFGLRRIGAVAVLPRSALVARFGEAGARIHARANGEETEPFRPRQTVQRLALALPLDPPAEDLEPLRFVLHRLVGALTAQLAGRGLGAERAVLALELDLAFAPAGTPARLSVEQHFPEPTAGAEAIERLLFARLERQPPPAAVERLELELRGTTPAGGRQLPLFEPQAAQAGRLEWQLARLALTFGEDRVRRVAIVDPEAPLPERRWTWQPIGLATDRSETGRPGRDRSEMARLAREGKRP